MCNASICMVPSGDFCIMSWTMKKPVIAHPSDAVTVKDFVSMLSWFIRYDFEKAEDFAFAWYHDNMVTVRKMVAVAEIRH